MKVCPGCEEVLVGTSEDNFDHVVCCTSKEDEMKTQTEAHTPTPWDVDPMGYLRGPNNENILETKANAAFVVRAVNAYDEDQRKIATLLEAVKDLISKSNAYRRSHIGEPQLEASIINAEEAIAQAEARS